jgi:hypothetical protein
MKRILIFLIILLCAVSCATQAEKYAGEPDACFQARYMAREKNDAAAGKLAEECANCIKRDWCIKILKEEPGTFKDFNDCWRQ